MKNRSAVTVLAAVVLLALGLAGCASGPTPQELEEKALLSSGERLEASGDYDAALVEYVKVLGIDDQNVEAHFRIGRVHSALGNTVTAREAFQRVLEKVPGHPGALEGLGLLYLASGQREVANSLLHKALARDGLRWRAFNGLGVLADLDGKHALAQVYFASALKQRPADAMLMNNLGYSYYLDGRLGDARRQFERAVTTDPGSDKGWSNLGLVQTRQGQLVKAVQTLERIMTPSEARYSVGYLCMIDGKLPEAERLLRDSIRKSSSYEPAAQEALKRVHDEMARRTTRGGDEAH